MIDLLAALLLLGSAEAVTICKTQRDTQGHWRWRIIEERKCWYPGRDRIDKSLLTWEQVIERKFYTREELAPHEEPEEIHPDEMVDSFEERWRLR